MKKLFISAFVSVTMFAAIIPVMANQKQKAVLKDGEPYITSLETYASKSSTNEFLMKVSANKSKNDIIFNNEKVGYFYFDKKADTIEIEVLKDVTVNVEWHCSKYYAKASLDGIGKYSLPQLKQDNGKYQSFDQVYIVDITENETEEPIEEEPASVNIGFIGYYLDNKGIPRQTSFYWQELKKGECINVEEVNKAYADWISQGGLELPEPTVWETSGIKPIYKEGEPTYCDIDFTNEQIENYYKSYFVEAGYVLPEVVISYQRYLAYVELWNDFYLDSNYANYKQILSDNGGLAHYKALLEEYSADSLPPYYHFDSTKKDVYDKWADELEPGLKIVCEVANIDLEDYVKKHTSNQ